MKLPPSVADLQRNHVVLELESIDRMYLNAYVPQLTSEGGIAGFFRGYLGHRFASTKQAGPMTEAFVGAIRDFIQDQDIPLVRFQKGQQRLVELGVEISALGPCQQCQVVRHGARDFVNMKSDGN